MKKWLSLFVGCCLLLTFIAACGDNSGQNNTDPEPTPEVVIAPPAPPAIYVLDFADGKSDFLAMNTGALGTDIDSEMAIADLDGAKALRLRAPNGNHLRLGINVNGLLGDRISDVRNIVFEIYADYPDGKFSTVSGRIAAINDELDTFADIGWQIFSQSKNPNQAILKIEADDGFSSAGQSLLEFSCTTNGPADKGEKPADIYIKSISFFDADNNAIGINTGAQFASPEGWGEFIFLGGWLLPNPPWHGDPGGWQMYQTPGVDGNDDDYMPWEVVAASFGLVFELPEQPESFSLAFHGPVSWDWKQIDNLQDQWANGEISILWSDVGFDPSLMSEDANGFKFYMGNWDQAQVDLVYLMYDEDAMP